MSHAIEIPQPALSAASVPFRDVQLEVTDEPGANSAPCPEAQEEARAAAGLQEARIALWSALLAMPQTLDRLAARGVTGHPEVATVVAAMFGLPVIGRDAATSDPRLELAVLLAEIDRPLEHAAALIEHRDHSRDVATLWDELQRRRGAFAATGFRLVSSIVRRFLGRGIDREDLVQEGTVGLLKAVDRFDHTRGFRFATYATWWVRNSLAQLVSHGRLVRVPARTRRAQYHLRRLQEEASARGDAAPTAEALAAEGLSPRIVRRLALLPVGGVVPIDPARDLDAQEADVASARPDLDLERSGMLEVVERSMHVLSERQAAVLARRFGLGGGAAETLTEIGESLSVTAERVRQIEAEALDVLRRALLSADPGLPIVATTRARRRRAKAS
jgi:RNA polymerase primary sigma factor